MRDNENYRISHGGGGVRKGEGVFRNFWVKSRGLGVYGKNRGFGGKMEVLMGLRSKIKVFLGLVEN